MSSLGSVLQHLKSGKPIAYPTEGVWGLGCDPENQDAIENLLRLKARSHEKGLILIGSKFFLIIKFCNDFFEKTCKCSIISSSLFFPNFTAL